MNARLLKAVLVLAVVASVMAMDGRREDKERARLRFEQRQAAKEAELAALKARRLEVLKAKQEKIAAQIREIEAGGDNSGAQVDGEVAGVHEVPGETGNDGLAQAGGNPRVDADALPDGLADDDAQTLEEDTPEYEDRDKFSDDHPVLSVVRIRGPPKADEIVQAKAHAGGFTAFVMDGSSKPTAYDGFSNILSSAVNNEEAYANSGVRRIVDRVATEDNFRGTVFVYGMSGSGKTFTMEGTRRKRDPNRFGLMHMALADLFVDILEKSQGARSAVVKVLPYQLYATGSGRTSDMDGFRLDSPFAAGRPNILFYDGGSDQTVPRLVRYSGGHKLPGTEDPFIEMDLAGTMPRLFELEEAERLTYARGQVDSLIREWSRNRVTEGTDMNKQSSRSHMIIEITYRIEMASREVRQGTLTLVDLAGMETSESGKNQVAKNQGKAINYSLDQLSRVISALASGDRPNLRMSTLTRALDSAFRGHPSQMQTVMIATVSPDMEHLPFTLQTLKYAQAALNIRPADEKPVKARGPRKVVLKAAVQDVIKLEKRKRNQKLDTYIRVRPILPAHESVSADYGVSCDEDEAQCTVTYPEKAVDGSVTVKQEVFPDVDMSYTGVFAPSDFSDPSDRGPSNLELYEQVVSGEGKILDVMLQNPKASSWGTIFCFGYTGTGKTYTMEGDAGDPGIIPLIMDALFEFKGTVGPSWVIRVTDFEIYGDTPTTTKQNTVLRDLLHPKKDSRGQLERNMDGKPILHELEVFEDRRTKLIKVVGAKTVVNKKAVRHNPWVTVTDPDETLKLYRRGGRFREVAPTDGNPEGSSRSHRVFRIGLFTNEKQADPIKQITLVDLAGLELMSDTSSGDRKIDGQGTVIRQGLFALKNMIVKINRNPKSVPTQEMRESDLARILYPAMSTNSPSAMIANIGPAIDDASKKRDITTLQYAAAILGKDVPY